MNSVPLTVLSFFFLSILYFFAFLSSLFVFCKFSKFMKEARIAKHFYIAIGVACLVRSGCFGAATGIYVKTYKKNVQESGNDSGDPKMELLKVLAGQ